MDDRSVAEAFEGMANHELTILVVSDVRFAREAIVEYLKRCQMGEVLSVSATALVNDPPGWEPSQVGRAVGLAIVDLHRVESSRNEKSAAEVIRVVRTGWPSATIVALGSRLELGAQAAGADLRLHARSVSVRELARIAMAVRAGDRPPADREPDATRWGLLSRRERQVLALVAVGHDNAKIAAMLGITQRTVKAHVSSLLRKLTAENRTELAIIARDAGFREPPLAPARPPGPAQP